MTRPRYLQAKELVLLGKYQQHAYLVKWYHFLFIEEEPCPGCPFWHYMMVLAYRTGQTRDIEGTYYMSVYRDILLNQLLP